VRTLVAFLSSVLFGWGFTTLVLTHPDSVPPLALLLAMVLAIEYWLAARGAKRRSAVLPEAGTAAVSRPEDA
jgi:hypothetical protein